MSSIDGLITGIDTAKVVEGLVALQKSQVDRLEARKSGIASEQAAFKGLEARILSFRSNLAKLTKSRDSVFDVRTATSSNEDILQATASSDSAAGTFTLRVEQLAKAEKIATTSFDDAESEITTGSVTFQVGTREAVTIDVDSENNTVQGLANSINAEATDIRASIINEGGSVRLLLSSNLTGAENQISVTNNLAATSGSATQPDFSGDAVEEAADAIVKFGSGPGAITVNSASNQVEDVVDGVTLNLTEADAEKEVVVTVKRETEDGAAAIRSFVNSYNSLNSYIDEQTKYNAETNVAGVLQGNSTVRGIQNDIRSLVSSSIKNANPELNSLSDIGIQFTDQGLLAISDAKFDKILNGEVEGVSLDDVKNLFALSGQPGNQKVEFLLGSSNTVSGGSNIEVDITQAASQATVLGTSALAGSIVIDSSNNELTFTLDGQDDRTISLLAGTYTQSELSDLVESAINNASGAGTVSATVDGGNLRITSDSYGSDSTLSSFTGTALSVLGFDGSESDEGTDVAGQFIVDGEIEIATGKARVLTGDSDNANTADLQLRILFNDSDVLAGSESDLTITRGYAGLLDQALESLLDPENGRIKFTNDGYERNIESIESSIDLVNEISDAKQEYLLAQFTALESAVASLQTTGNIVASQLSNLIQ